MPELKAAVISPCGTYRYRLARIWDKSLPRLGWIMLNPSTADAEVDDPTVVKCGTYARRWGYGGILVCNLYALRSPHPHMLRQHPDPVGPDNDEHLRALLAGPADVVGAWGALASNSRVDAVLAMPGSERLLALRETKTGQPGHPLYLSLSLTPTPWRAA